MSIFVHVILAIISLIITGYTAFVPSKSHLRATYASIVLTVGSGSVLAIQDHSMILHVCSTGLVYLAIESAGIVFSIHRARKLARELA